MIYNSSRHLFGTELRRRTALLGATVVLFSSFGGLLWAGRQWTGSAESPSVVSSSVAPSQDGAKTLFEMLEQQLQAMPEVVHADITDYLVAKPAAARHGEVWGVQPREASGPQVSVRLNVQGQAKFDHLARIAIEVSSETLGIPSTNVTIVDASTRKKFGFGLLDEAKR